MNWKRSVNLRRQRIIGLDIGSSMVKVVQLREGKAGYTVTGAGIVEIENGTDGDRAHAANTKEAIHRCLQMSGVQTRLAVCGVCGSEVAVRDFAFPPLPPEELASAVTLEAGQVCPFDTAERTIDYQVVTETDDRASGILVATTNSLVRQKVQLAKAASVACALMDVDGLALLNCFNHSQQRRPGQTVAILNVGHSYSTLAINGANETPFIRDIPFAGHDIVKQVAAQTGTSPQTVRAQLCGHTPKAQSAHRGILQTACERLIADVNETLRFYAAKQKTGMISQILVCGGFALISTFVQALDRGLTGKAVLWNPFDNINCDARSARPNTEQKNLLEQSGPAMAVAAGLAMRSI